MAKKLITSWDILEKIADDRRFTKVETETVSGDCESWKENAEALAERLEDLIGLDLNDIETDDLRKLNMADAVEAIWTLRKAVETAEEIREALNEFVSLCDDFSATAEEWREAEDAEERADARERLIDTASDLHDKASEVQGYGVDVEAEGGLG